VSWAEVEKTVADFNVAYHEWLATTEVSGSKAHQAVYAAFITTHEARKQALAEQWDPEKDGYRSPDTDEPSYGRTLQRYYAENRLEGKVKR
jgi:hypothetical protein